MSSFMYSLYQTTPDDSNIFSSTHYSWSAIRPAPVEGALPSVEFARLQSIQADLDEIVKLIPDTDWMFEKPRSTFEPDNEKLGPLRQNV
ncbi:hypothetical protein HDV00_008699 [Rhizophlyctis rosea]|nr:hypothetical protein HDV00_008699 [Rhizophlyctis rosea]